MARTLDKVVGAHLAFAEAHAAPINVGRKFSDPLLEASSFISLDGLASTALIQAAAAAVLLSEFEALICNAGIEIVDFLDINAGRAACSVLVVEFDLFAIPPRLRKRVARAWRIFRGGIAIHAVPIAGREQSFGLTNGRRLTKRPRVKRGVVVFVVAAAHHGCAFRGRFGDPSNRVVVAYHHSDLATRLPLDQHPARHQ